MVQFTRVAETLEKDESLVSATLGDSVLDQLHHQVEVEVDGAELLLVVGVDASHHVEGVGKSLVLSRGTESLTEGSVVADVVADLLVHGKIKHVEFNGQVGA